MAFGLSLSNGWIIDCPVLKAVLQAAMMYYRYFSEVEGVLSHFSLAKLLSEKLDSKFLKCQRLYLGRILASCDKIAM